MTVGGLPQVKAEPGPSRIASHTPRPHAKASGLVLEVHVDRPVGRLSRVRIDGVLAATADRHHVHQFWFVGTKENGPAAGHFNVHRKHMVTFKLCTKAGRRLSTSKPVYVHRL